MARSQYASVVFDLKRDIFPANTDVECQFEITDTLEANKWDYVGIYPVAWRSQKDYVTYHYITMPPNYQKGKKAFSKIVFEAHCLPKDDEFYQFCYVSRQLNCICGASDPFQFRSTSGKEYVEEECEDMMVIRPKTDVMQDEIQSLSHKLMVMSTEREELQEKVQTMEKTLGLRDSIITQLQAEVKTLEEMEEQEREEQRESDKRLEACLNSLKSVGESNNELEKELQELKDMKDKIEEQIVVSKATIRSLEAERDELSGKNQSLVDELNTYKMQVTESQTKVAQNSKTIARLNEALELTQNQCSSLVEECEDLKKQRDQQEEALKQMEEQLVQLTQSKTEAERRRSDLTHELQNANDKLLACDTMKIKLSRDLEAYEQTQQKMSTKFETQESDLRRLREKAEQKSRECSELKKQLTATTRQLEETRKDMHHTEASLNQTLLDIQEQIACRDHFAKKHAEKEREHTETHKQLEVIRAQLKAVAEEKMALQIQLRSFEDELQETLVLKDKEVAGKLDELKDKTRLIEEKDQELERRDADIQKLQEDLRQQGERLQQQGQELGENSRAVSEAADHVREMEDRYNDRCQEVERLKEDRDYHSQKCEEMKEAVEELEALMGRSQEEEAARYHLVKANETLKARLEAKDKELSTLKQELVEREQSAGEQRRGREEREQEVEELKQRLELCKLEFKTKALESHKMIVHLQKEASRQVRRASGSSDSPSTDVATATTVSDTEATEGDGRKKYKQLYKVAKREKEVLMAQLGERDKKLSAMRRELSRQEEATQSTRNDVILLQGALVAKDRYIEELQKEIEELEGNKEEEGEPDNDATDREEVPPEKVQLVFGNPYSAKVEAASEPPSQQTIIRSTLEEEAESGDPMSAAGEGHQLPPPLQPQVVSPRGAAASSDVEDSVAEEGTQEVFEDCRAMPPQDDSFLDAIGEGMKICPFCQTSVMASSDFEEHVVNHFDRICPVCRSQADEKMSPKDFEQHVNKCLDLESASAPPQTPDTK